MLRKCIQTGLQPCLHPSLFRSFTLNCLLIHPVVGGRKATLADIKAAEEAVGLVKALDYSCISLLDSKPLMYDSRTRSKLLLP